jgi:hypothetical protein
MITGEFNLQPIYIDILRERNRQSARVHHWIR